MSAMLTKKSDLFSVNMADGMTSEMKLRMKFERVDKVKLIN